MNEANLGAQVNRRIGALTPVKYLLFERLASRPAPAALRGSPARYSGRGGQGQWCRFPNGMQIHCHNPAEAAYFYQDIFVDRSYLRHGVHLDAGATVFDVGANVGVFLLFVHQNCPGARIFAFEPVPPIFEHLRRNVVGHGAAAELYCCGLSNRSGTGRIGFYPESSGLSSLYADADDDRHTLVTVVSNQAEAGDADVKALLIHADDYCDHRLKRIDMECSLQTLSAIINEAGIERIDLLKLDVQKSEMDVLLGIGPGHWGHIRQIVAEVHDVNGRLREMTRLLSARGYKTTAEQDPLYRGSNIFKIFAGRGSDE